MEFKDTVVINENDLKMVEDFFQHYNDPKTNNLLLSPALRKEIDLFRENSKSNLYTTEDQARFTIALVGSLANTTHPLLTDSSIKDVMDACKAAWTDAQFYEELEKVIRDPQKEEG